MKRKAIGVVAIAAAYVFLTAGLAQASTITQTDNGNRVTASYTTLAHCSTGICFYSAYCFGSNHHTPAAAKVLVSYVCQYRDSAKVWHDFYTAPANYCTNCTDVQGADELYPCNYLARGTWYVRGQADGYWQDASGTKHQFKPSGALSTPSPYAKFVCA